MASRNFRSIKDFASQFTVEYDLNKNDHNMIIMIIYAKYDTTTVYYLYYVIT